jgi:dihydrofolate reductase
VAAAKNEAIGFKGDLPWPKIPKEMKHFKEVTMSKEPLSFSTSEYAFKNCFF